LTKRVTRKGGPIKDVIQLLAKHNGPKGANKSMEVIKLLAMSPSKGGKDATM